MCCAGRPEVPLLDVDGPVIVMVEGRETNLTCTTRYGDPPPQLSWWKSQCDLCTKILINAREVPQKGEGTRHLSTVLMVPTREENGWVSWCEARQAGWPSLVSNTAHLYIKCKPLISPSSNLKFKLKYIQPRYIIHNSENNRSNVRIMWYYVQLKAISTGTMLIYNPYFVIHVVWAGSPGKPVFSIKHSGYAGDNATFNCELSEIAGNRTPKDFHLVIWGKGYSHNFF